MRTHVIRRLLRVFGRVWFAAPDTVSAGSGESGGSGGSGDEFGWAPMIVKTQYTGPFFPENGHGNLCLTMDILRNPNNPRNQRNPLNLRNPRIPWICMVNHEYPWSTMDFHGGYPLPFSGKNGPVHCVFTVIGALWEFSSGSSRSTGSNGIEVNPSKMDPWFPTPGSRMTVVFHKTPSNQPC